MVPMYSGGHEDKMRTKKLLHEWQRNGSGFINTDELSLTKFVVIGRMNILPDRITYRL